MAVQINWALDRTPDFSQNAIAGYQAGQQAGRQQATVNALKQYATDPRGSINALTSVDPVAASQLRQGYVQDQALQRQQDFRTALSKGDMTGATRVAAGDPALMQSLTAYQGHMKALNDQQAAGLQAVAGIADPVQRAQVWDSTIAPKLVQLGQDPNAVSSKNLDLSDQGIKAAVAQTMTAKDQLDLAMKGADLGVKQGQLAETSRHDQATEGQQAAQLKEMSRHNQVDEKNSGITAAASASNAATNAKKLQLMQSGGAMDPDVIEFYAERNAADGYLPSMGMGAAGAALKSAILARSAQLQQSRGGTGADAAATVAGAKGNSAALSQLSKQGATVKAAEQTASQAADLALQLGQAGGAGPSAQIFNQPIQKIRAAISDPHAAAFNNALGTFRDEYAKVIGGGQITDKLRSDVDSRLNATMSLPELQKVISTMKQEMAFRSKSYDDQQASLRGQIKGGGAAPAPAPAAGSVIHYDAQGNRIK